MAFDANGYDPVTGQNSGDLGFQSLQGYRNGQKYYAPTPFNPGDFGGINAPGYIDFGSLFNPATNPNDYQYYGNYGEALAAGNPGGGPISYGSAPTNPVNSDPFLNGVDYTSGASYANQAANGIGTPTPQTYGIGGSGGDFGMGGGSGSAPGVTPYTPTTEPGYRPPQFSQAAPTGTQFYGAQGHPQDSYQPGGQATFLYGDNGSAGSVAGVFSNNTPGQSTSFYANEPASLTQGDTNPSLGQFTSYNPLNGPQKTQASNPGLQALQQSRSQP